MEVFADRMTSYMDLLGIPYEVLNCAQVVKVYLQRLGLEDAADSIPTDPEAGAAVMQSGASGWASLNGAPVSQRERGTVIVCESHGELEVSVLVGSNIALTSSKRFGVHARPTSRIRNWIGCYRWDS